MDDSNKSTYEQTETAGVDTSELLHITIATNVLANTEISCNPPKEVAIQEMNLNHVKKMLHLFFHFLNNVKSMQIGAISHRYAYVHSSLILYAYYEINENENAFR